MANADIERYLDMITSQFSDKPKFVAHLTAILQKMDGPHIVMKDIPGKFDVYTATGEQLDIIGQLVGVDRNIVSISIPGYDPALDDDMYRMVILAKIMQNQWDGTNETFRELWENTIGEWLDAVYKDNQDMTISANIIGTVEPVLTELILNGLIIPKPAGVKLAVTITEKSRTTINPGSLFGDNAAQIGIRPLNQDYESSAPVRCGAGIGCNAATITFRPTQPEVESRIEMASPAMLSSNILAVTSTAQ